MKVSVIVTCYNLSRYLPEALDSVLAQDFNDWECIVVNDGSEDSTSAVAKGYTEKDSRFHLLELKNGGVIRARNEGVKASCGEYLLFLDADDILFADYVGKAVHILDSRPDVLIVSGPAEPFSDGPAKIAIEIPPFSKDTMLARNSLHISSMLRRKDFDRAGGFNPDMAAGLEDWDLWLGVLENDGEVEMLPDPVLRYRIRRDSRNKRISDDTLKDLRRKLWEHHKVLYSKYFLDPVDTMEYRRLAYTNRKLSRLPGVRILNLIKNLFR